MISSDTAFGEQAIAKGYLTPDQLEACLRRQRELREAGEDLRLGQVLVREGHLTANQFMVLQIGPAIVAEDLPPTEPETAPFPRPLGKYVLKREIARGGMGVVYEAEDTQLHRRVALKTLRDEEADLELVERLRREATIAAQFVHPNIVAIHEVGTMPNEAGRPITYLAMDYVEGRTLADLIREGTTKRKDLVQKLEAVARAAAYAHSKGVVHRDLKPANVLVDQDGRALLTDFGLARAETVSARTCSGIVMGTPQYMAPEQVEGKTHQIDARTDVYALGVILYEILAGRPPFWAPSPAKLYSQILNDEPVRPTRLSKTVNPDLETVCLKAMEKRREDRYASAASFADDLRRFLDGDPILASRIGWWRRVGRRVRRRRALIVPLALGCAAGLGLLTVQQLRLQEERRASRDREESLKLLAMQWSAIIERKNELRTLRVPVEKARSGLEEAQKEVESYVRQWPEEPQGYYVLARAKMYLGDLDGSEVHARTAVTKRPDFRPGWSLLGMLKLERYIRGMEGSERLVSQRRSEREGLLEEAIRSFDRGPESGYEKEEFRKWGLAWTREDQVMERLAQAMRARYVAKNVEEARDFLTAEWKEYRAEDFAVWIGLWSKSYREQIRWYDEAIASAQGFADAYYERGNSKMKLKDCKGAIADYDKVLELRPAFADALINRGAAKRRLRRFDEAIADYDRAIELQRDDPSGYYNRGNVKRDLKRLEEAIADYDRAIELDPNHGDAFLNRGYAKEDLGQPAEALKDFDRALEIEPKNAGLYNFRGILKKTLERVEEAIADYDQAIRLNPDFAEALYNRGHAKLKLGRWEDALPDFDRAIDLRKDYWHALQDRGIAYSNLKRYEEALADLDRALEIHGTSAKLYNDRGTVRCACGKLDEAIDDYDRALELTKDLPEALANRGVAKRKKKDLKGAEADLTHALDLSPKDWPYRAAFFQVLEEIHREMGKHP